MSIPVTLIPGDSTGPEICEAIQPLFAAAGADITWDVHSVGDRETSAETLDAIRRNGVALMAFQRGLRDRGELPPIVRLRKELGVYANLRPLKNLVGVDSVYTDVDILLVRETSEDVYAHLEHESIPGVFESLKVTTEAACERIARRAFATAKRMGRKKVTVVHKSNIMKLSDGLFLRTAMRVAEEWPSIQVDECIVDALCMKLVLDPGRFDVLLCANLFGDIVGDLCTGLVGGHVNAPSLNFAPDAAVFTVAHGDPPELVGTGFADPLPLLLSSLYMLEHLELHGPRQRLGAALEAAVVDGIRPKDLGGEASCADYIGAVLDRLG